MPWSQLNNTMREAMIQFLEPNPPANSHGKISLKYISFYSSELKNLKQLVDGVDQISQRGLQGTDKSSIRYRNTLRNIGLIQEISGTYVLSKIGITVNNYISRNGLNSGNIQGSGNSSHRLEIEKVILESLIEELVNGDIFNLCTDTFKNILFSVQETYSNIPSSEINSVLDDPDTLYFLQSINSTGDEIKRYFRLNPTLRSAYYQYWRSLSEKKGFPNTLPTGLIDFTIYNYCRVKAKATLQYDCRHRIEAFLKAYRYCINKFGDSMPILNSDLDNINQRNQIQIMSNNNSEHFFLKEKKKPSSTEKPRQRIISGCPGSGKSKYLDDEIKSLENSYSIKTSFHQESTYFDFVGTYKPTPLYEKNEDILDSYGNPASVPGKPVINYSFEYGPLVQSILVAINNPNYNVVLVIDEINRGNVGVIFGDFFQLLDRDPLNFFESKYDILPNTDLLKFLRVDDFMKAYLDKNSNHLKLPGNLFIWGSMNSADQGVFPIDSAFRRRWEFEYMGYSQPCSYGSTTLKYDDSDISWDDFRNRINKYLLKEIKVPEDKLIGPYFLNEAEIESPKKVLNKLFLYLWDDVVRFQQRKLFKFDSFSDLKKAWGNGKGKIFDFDFKD